MKTPRGNTEYLRLCSCCASVCYLRISKTVISVPFVVAVNCVRRFPVCWHVMRRSVREGALASTLRYEAILGCLGGRGEKRDENADCSFAGCFMVSH